MRYYTVNRDRFDHDGKRHTHGDLVQLSESQGERLLALGAVSAAPEGFTPAEPDQGVAETTIAAQGTEHALDAGDAGTATSATTDAASGGEVAAQAAAGDQDQASNDVGQANPADGGAATGLQESGSGTGADSSAAETPAKPTAKASKKAKGA